VASIKDYLPIKYRDYSVELHTINKINTIQDGLCVVDKSKPIATAQVIYVDIMYAYYVRCSSLAETMKMAAESIVQGFYYTSVNQNVEMSKDNISDMVHEVNLTAVVENERLSDNVYLYDGAILVI
jgi:hypothetical protein